MLITKVKETITLNSGQVITEKIFLDITNISFGINDGKIIAYIKMGYETDQIVPMTEGEIETGFNQISHKGKSFTDDRLKEMLDANGIVFNSDASNFLLREMIDNNLTILLSVITEEPGEYFGLTADKWEEAI
jgi:hypothetical protein